MEELCNVWFIIFDDTWEIKSLVADGDALLKSESSADNVVAMGPIMLEDANSVVLILEQP
jgi:hypothetical protein